MTARLASNPQPLIASLSKELKLSKQTLEHQSQELLTANQLNHQLLQRIRELEGEIERAGQPRIERDSHNSNLPPSLDPPCQKVPRTRCLRKQSGLKPGGQFGHRGTTLRQVTQPDQLILHSPESCMQCGAPLQHSTLATSVRRQVFDISDGRVQVTEHRAETRRCPTCATTTKATFPLSVRAPVQYGMGVLSRSVYLHLYQLLPVARTAETMRDLFDCHISVATIQRATRVSSAKLIYTEQRIKAVIRDSRVIGVDETGLRVAGRGGYIHVARTEELTHYAFDARRGKAAMDEIGILPQFQGTLVRDCYLSYSRFEQCRHSLCNAHLLREMVFIQEIDATQKVWTTPLSKLLAQIKDATAQARADGAPQLSHQQQESWLKRYQQLVRKAEKLNPLPSPGKDADVEKKKQRDQKPSPSNLIKRLQQKRDQILRFMTDLSVPFDNNGSERDLRIIKLQQKISGCFRTADGARNFCRVRSYLSTARKQGHSLLYSLERVLNGKPLVFQPAES
ncbi:MAG TPA: IS66 family transposase [Pyrinomonadaceae bacterium]|nr:IS66 family transposase [Pyrinomonadaceae bacterium]